MILSEKTLEILANFGSINPSMKLDWDGSIAVVSPQGNMLAVAKVPERYPFAWFISDVPQLLGALKIMDQSAVAECHSDHVLFKQPNATIQYRFAEPSLVRSVTNKEGTIKSVSATAGITWKEMQQLIKAAMMLRNTHVKVQTNGNQNQLILTSYNLNNPAVSNYSLNIPINDLSEEFSFEESSFKIEHLNLLKNDYTLKVAAKCFYLESDDGNVKYWIGKEK